MATQNPSDIPLDLVINMKNQGLNPNQIIQNLQRQGYPQESISNAMNQAEIKGNIENIPQNMQNNPQIENPMQMQPQSISSPQDQSKFENQNIDTEELIEAIINEKWEELLKDINQIIEWKDNAETRLIQMEEKVKNTKEEFDKLHQAIIGKVGEYDKNLTNVGTEVKAMEKVFQKVLPSFVDNINELNRITENIKKKVPSSETKDKK